MRTPIDSELREIIETASSKYSIGLWSDHKPVAREAYKSGVIWTLSNFFISWIRPEYKPPVNNLDPVTRKLLQSHELLMLVKVEPEAGCFALFRGYYDYGEDQWSDFERAIASEQVLAYSFINIPYWMYDDLTKPIFLHKKAACIL
jgi:hypothetical protein